MGCRPGDTDELVVRAGGRPATLRLRRGRRGSTTPRPRMQGPWKSTWAERGEPARVVSLHAERTTVGGLLLEIQRQTGLTFAYDPQFPATRSLTLEAASITVAAALGAILVGTWCGCSAYADRPRVAYEARAAYTTWPARGDCREGHR